MLVEELKNLLKPTLESLGYELWGLLYQPQNGRSALRVFIESPKGITIEDCERASRQIASVLDAEDLIRSAYNLEVSSPGLDRNLFELSHYKRYVGSPVKLKLFEPIGHQRSFAGKILEVNDDGIIRLEIDGKSHEFAFNKIQTGQVIY